MPPSADATRPADVELVLPARPENVGVVRHVLGGMADALEIDPEALGNLRLAVSEACTNVVVHAYGDGERTPGLLEVEVTVDRPLLHVVVRDRGRGLAPRPDSPGMGMGLPLIAAVSDSVEIDSVAGANEVRMTFVIASAAGEAR
jgi:anti-sigma regulatory factor (Ser/Thr protein kinase)